MNFKSLAVISAIVLGAPASAATFTTTSPTSAGELPSGVSAVGGLVLDLVGINGARVVSQLSASSLFTGFAGSSNQTIGTFTGLTGSITGALGGGISEAAVRVTLDDGDTSAGEFDANDNDLRVNGVSFGDFTNVTTVTTDGVGNVSGTPHAGFANNLLDTGFFYLTDATSLATLFASFVSTEQAVVSLFDTDSGDNFYDFTQGIAGSLTNVGSAPTVTAPAAVPLPATLSLLLVALGGLGLFGRTRSVA